MIDRSVVHGCADDSHESSDDLFDDDSDDNFDDSAEDSNESSHLVAKCSSAGRRISIRLGEVTWCGELPCTAT